MNKDFFSNLELNGALDKFTNEYKNKFHKTKNSIFTSIKNKIDWKVNIMKNILIKNVAIISGILIVCSGVVFASSKIIENIWKNPEKIANVTTEITEESKKENITEEQAKEIAISKLKEIGFNTNIINTNHFKEIDSNKIVYRFDTEDNYEISINGITGEFYDIWNNNPNIQDINIEITENEAIEIANKYYKLFGFKDGEYEISNIHSVNKEGSGNGPGFKIDIEYNKKYGNIFNPYECISIRIESKNKDFDYFRVENMPFDNNEIIITKGQAIDIALNEDKKIDTKNIVETKAEKMIVKMNADAYERINNTKKYYEAMQTPNYPNEERNYYNVDAKIRNAWVIVLTYEDSGDVEKRYTEGKYSYFVDCTTGEIIGGHVMDYIYSSSKN